MKRTKLAFALVFIPLLTLTACGDSNELQQGQVGTPSAMPAETPPETPVVMQTATEVPTEQPTSTSEEPTATLIPSPTNPEVDSACSGAGSGLVVAFSSLDPLVWQSHQIVEGVIVEQLPPIFGPPMYENGPRFIYTDFVFRVENRLRGVPQETIRIRQEGGTIGDCTVVIEDAPQFSVGDQLLLFLYPDQFPGEGKQDAPTYGVLGRDQGVWAVKDDVQGQVPRAVPISENENLLPDAATDDGIPLDVLAQQVFEILSVEGGAPTTGPGMAYAVPLEEAPLPPTIPDFGASATPTAQP